MHKAVHSQYSGKKIKEQILKYILIIGGMRIKAGINELLLLLHSKSCVLYQITFYH
jgi:hypothetical protein